MGNAETKESEETAQLKLQLEAKKAEQDKANQIIERQQAIQERAVKTNKFNIIRTNINCNDGIYSMQQTILTSHSEDGLQDLSEGMRHLALEEGSGYKRAAIKEL